MSAPRRLLAIGFDAAAGTLVRRWAEAGELPVMANLIGTGASARLSSLVDLLPESAWPTLLTGCEPATHGVYNWRETRPGGYERVRRPEGSYRAPFWQVLRRDAEAEAGRPRVVALDVPGAPLLAEDGSTMVVGWGQRSQPKPASWPPDLFDRVTSRHGRYARNRNRETHGRALLARAQLRALERMAATRARLLGDLMAGSEWDVCVACFPESHDGGHSFHLYAAPDEYPFSGPRSWGLDDGLLRIYRAIDRAIGELIAAAPPDTHVAVISCFGMRPNTNGVSVLPRVLEGLGHQAARPPSRASRRTEFARSVALTAVPRPLARRVRSWFLPADASDRHTEQMWIESTDWTRTRAWAEAEPGSGWIRLNVRGREPHGTVEPGAEYDELCAQIAADLLELRNADTGDPAVEAVLHRGEVTSGPNIDALPDLLVRWSRRAPLRRVEHPRIGVVEEDGESRVSEHDDDGFLVMAGPLVRRHDQVHDGRLEDVAPTLIHLMGGAVPADIDGRVLTDLLTPAAGDVRRREVDWADDAWATAPA